MGCYFFLPSALSHSWLTVQVQLQWIYWHDKVHRWCQSWQLNSSSTTVFLSSAPHCQSFPLSPSSALLSVCVSLPFCLSACVTLSPSVPLWLPPQVIVSYLTLKTVCLSRQTETSIRGLTADGEELVFTACWLFSCLCSLHGSKGWGLQYSNQLTEAKFALGFFGTPEEWGVVLEG